MIEHVILSLTQSLNTSLMSITSSIKMLTQFPLDDLNTEWGW